MQHVAARKVFMVMGRSDSQLLPQKHPPIAYLAQSLQKKLGLPGSQVKPTSQPGHFIRGFSLLGPNRTPLDLTAQDQLFGMSKRSLGET